MKKGHRREAFELGGSGRHMQNKMSKTTKRNLDRKVDKRRRRLEQQNNAAWVEGITDGD
jgi:hypothetical protein